MFWFLAGFSGGHRNTRLRSTADGEGKNYKSFLTISHVLFTQQNQTRNLKGACMHSRAVPGLDVEIKNWHEKYTKLLYYIGLL